MTYKTEIAISVTFILCALMTYKTEIAISVTFILCALSFMFGPESWWPKTTLVSLVAATVFLARTTAEARRVIRDHRDSQRPEHYDPSHEQRRTSPSADMGAGDDDLLGGAGPDRHGLPRQ